MMGAWLFAYLRRVFSSYYASGLNEPAAPAGTLRWFHDLPVCWLLSEKGMRAFDAPLSSLFSTCINLPPPAAMSCNGVTTHLHLCPSRVSTAYFAAMRHTWP